MTVITLNTEIYSVRYCNSNSIFLLKQLQSININKNLPINIYIEKKTNLTNSLPTKLNMDNQKEKIRQFDKSSINNLHNY